MSAPEETPGKRSQAEVEADKEGWKGTIPVRPGEEIPSAPLASYLKSHLPGLGGELTIRQFPSGHSNLTYLLDFSGEQLVLRRPPRGTKAKTAHDMGREYHILRALAPFYPYCPRVRLYCQDEDLIGAPFFVMDKMEGMILKRPLPAGLLFTPEEARGLCESIVDALVTLHGIDYRAAGLEDFGKPAGYVSRQVEGWSRRYERAKTPDVPDFAAVRDWLAKNQPPESGHVAILHNDYRLDNLVFDRACPLSLVGVLDWEMATIGDPLMDLGAGLAYWIDYDDPAEFRMISMVPTTDLPGSLTRGDVIKRYGQKTGIPMEAMEFYYCFGLFRLAVIAQQIYYRFYQGETEDQRFKILGQVVAILEERAYGIIR